MDGHDRALRAGDRTLDRDQIVFSVDLDDAQVLNSHADRTHVAGQTLALEHMGAVRVTVQNLSIVKVDAENNLIAIKGAIPGPKGSVVCVSDSVKA